MTPHQIHQYLTQSEIAKIDMRAIAKIVLDRTITLSLTVNKEIIEPISKWIDDPDFMKKHKVMIDDGAPNWADYKRRQRLWSKIECQLQTEKMKPYWEAIRKKKNLRKELSRMFGKSPSQNKNQPGLNITEDFITPIIAPFSPPEQQKAETERQFKQARTLSPSNLLPWTLILSNEIKEPTFFSQLKTYYPENRKQDVVSKLTHLLHLTQEKKVTLHQANHFEDIMIEPIDTDQDQEIRIKDITGQNYAFDWHQLSDQQKSKLVADLKENRILCRTA